MGTDYERVLADAVSRLAEISRQTEEMEIERAKLMQFIRATMNLLPEEKQKQFTKLLDTVCEVHTHQAESLTAAIRKVMRAEGRDWLTTAEVRDRLIQTGFDFSQYASNPLASVSTTLRRISEKEDEFESRVIEGVTMYRWKEARRNLRLRDVVAGPKGTVGLGAIFDALAREEKKQ